MSAILDAALQGISIMKRFSIFTQALGFAGWIGLACITAGIGGLASINASDFYLQLSLPDWAPPPWVFGPVWSVLFLMMGVSAWLVWRVNGFRPARLALSLFLIQLVFNALWSWLFFAWHHGAFAFIDILILWTLIVATLIRFWRIRPIAGWLLLPYVMWVSFAAALNYAIWQLNPQSLS